MRKKLGREMSEDDHKERIKRILNVYYHLTKDRMVSQEVHDQIIGKLLEADDLLKGPRATKSLSSEDVEAASLGKRYLDFEDEASETVRLTMSPPPNTLLVRSPEKIDNVTRLKSYSLPANNTSETDRVLPDNNTSKLARACQPKDKASQLVFDLPEHSGDRTEYKRLFDIAKENSSKVRKFQRGPEKVRLS